MTREQFLEKTWKSYPRVLPPQSEFLLGRIVKLENQRAMVKRDKKITTIEWSCIELSEDDRLGVSCPLQCLREGDVIAYKELKHKVGLFYLLSPNLSLEKPNTNQTDQWSFLIRRVEDFFLTQGFYKARTPFLVSSPGVDHHIDFLEVKGSQTGRQWTLPTSPEIHLKKLLCQGHDKVFEIKTCFRDDLEGPQHSVEFEMLEWYRCYEPLESLVCDIENLFLELKEVFPEISHELTKEIKKTTIREQFSRHLSFDLTPRTSREELFQLVKNLNIDFDEADDWNTLFFRLFIEKIEPHLGQNQPEALFDFPASQASLAQINEEGWAQRFELYWRGVELANAYWEVNDPKINKERFLQEHKLRQKENKLSYIDKDFFHKMNRGMPPTSGIAFGLERFFRQVSHRISG